MTTPQQPTPTTLKTCATTLFTVAALGVAGCATGTHLTYQATLPPEQLYVARGTVTQINPPHGPTTWCPTTPEKTPPECDGYPVRNWDWGAVTIKHSVDQVTWAHDVAFTGRLHNEAFHVVGNPTTDVQRVPPVHTATNNTTDLPLAPLCAEPTQGWPTTHPEANNAAAQHLINQWQTHHTTLPGFASAWVTALPETDVVVLNVTHTTDLPNPESAVREHWAGPLCMATTDTTYQERQQLRHDAITFYTQHSNFTATNFIDLTDDHNFLTLNVFIDDGSIQNALDDEFGPGTILVHSLALPEPE